MKKLLVLRVWKESLPGFTKPRSRAFVWLLARTWILQKYGLQGALTYLTIQTTWPEKGWVESVGTVCGHDYFNLGGEGKDGDFHKSLRRKSIYITSVWAGFSNHDECEEEVKEINKSTNRATGSKR